MNIDLKALGFTQEELQNRVVEKICGELLEDVGFDPYSDEEVPVASKFKRQINEQIKKRIDDTIQALAEKYLLPNVSKYIEDLTLQQTNQWGEKTGQPVTFIEYLVKQGQAYMQEPVDSYGKSKGQTGGSTWYDSKQTRITFLINQYLHGHIEKAMKDSMTIGLGELAKGLHETTRLKLNEIAASMKVAVSVK